MPVPRLLTSVLAAGVALALTACGSDSADEAGAAAGSAATRTVTDTFTGTQVEIPVEPRRVVALWRTGEELVDIGLKPVGTLEGEIDPKELGADVAEKYAGIPTVGTFEDVDVEKVIALDPDLIIGMDNGGLSIKYDELRKVAPTVILKIAEPTDVWDNYPKVADLVGRSTDYSTLNGDLNARMAKLKETYGAGLAAKQVTSFGMTEGEIWVETSKSLTYRRFAGVGYSYNPRYTATPKRYVTQLAAENLPQLDTQTAIFYEVDIDGKPSAEVAKVLASPSFTRLAAAKAGRVFPLTAGTIYTFAAGNKQVDDLEAAAKKLAAQS